MSKDSYELVSTKPPESEDEESSETETLVYESTNLKSIAKQLRKNKQFLKSAPPPRCFFLVAALFTVLLIILLIAGYIAFEAQQKPDHLTPTTNETIQAALWHRHMSPASSELSIVVSDINNDSIPDLILDNIQPWYFHERYRACPGKPTSCMEDVGVSPCRVRILAFDGQNGSNVWEKWVEFAPFAANCRHDLNLDGVADCVFAGRQGSFAVINLVDGSLIWIIDPAATFPGYNYYYPLFIHDFDKDGVVDIIVTHGGDQIYEDENRKRSNGFIFVVSGRTGQQISDRIPMPDGQETYSNSIAYNISGNIELVLFGSGGETISGSLWAITVQSLQEHVDTWRAHKKPDKYSPNQVYFDTQCMSNEEVGSLRPVFHQGTFKYVKDKEEWLSKCPILYNKHEPLWNPYKLCVYEFVPGGKTGTILPPVIIDYNGDGIKDLLVSQFNDHIIMIDGSSGNIQWNHTAKGTQSYSIPSPVHFNEDDTPDFLIRFNKGKWMNYDYSYMGVLDGNNGELLWTMNCSMGAMASAVTVKSSRKGHDGKLFFASGCEQEMNRMKREIKEKGVLHHEFRDNVCLEAHLGLEQAECSIQERSRRHEDDNGPDQETKGDRPNDGEMGPNHPEVFRLQEIDFSVIQDAMPNDLWEATDKTDKFPNPWTDTQSFIEEYCGIPYERMINRVYFLTPNIIKSGNIKPLFVNKPFVYKPPSSGYKNLKKRHGGSTIEEEQYSKMFKDRKKVRCAHIITPQMLVGTPTVGDFNKDGKLDAAVSINYDGLPNELYLATPLHPNKVSVTTFTIEDKLNEIYGPEINEIVDFGSYYPADKQPWGQYMGAKGDGIYEPPSS